MSSDAILAALEQIRQTQNELGERLSAQLEAMRGEQQALKESIAEVRGTVLEHSNRIREMGAAVLEVDVKARRAQEVGIDATRGVSETKSELRTLQTSMVVAVGKQEQALKEVAGKSAEVLAATAAQDKELAKQTDILERIRRHQPWLFAVVYIVVEVAKAVYQSSHLLHLTH